MAVHRAVYCTVRNQQNPVAANHQVFYNHAHNDWVMLERRDFTLPFNERVDGSSPSSLIPTKSPAFGWVFLLVWDLSNHSVAAYGLEVKQPCAANRNALEDNQMPLKRHLICERGATPKRILVLRMDSK